MRLFLAAFLSALLAASVAARADDRQAAITLIEALGAVSGGTPQCGQTDYIAIMDGLDMLAEKGGISLEDAESSFHFHRTKAQGELRDGAWTCAEIDSLIEKFSAIGLDLR